MVHIAGNARIEAQELQSSEERRGTLVKPSWLNKEVNEKTKDERFAPAQTPKYMQVRQMKMLQLKLCPFFPIPLVEGTRCLSLDEADLGSYIR